MILHTTNLLTSENKDKLLISPIVHQSTWEYYYRNYNNALCYLCMIGNSKKYLTNYRFMGFMYLFRHTVELLLKYNLDNNGYNIPKTHSLKQLRDEFNGNILPDGFSDFIDQIDLDEDGSCYKYYLDKDSQQPYFIGERLEILSILSLYSSFISNSQFTILPFCEGLNKDDKILKWEFTFHTGECHGDGIVRTHFDETCFTLISGVIADKIQMSECYLPFLFLMRHAMELAIKTNTENLYSTKTPSQKRALRNEHSLCKLMNIYKSFLDGVQIPPNLTELKEQLNYYKPIYEALNINMHQFDVNSIYFRYPFDKNGNTLRLPLVNDIIFNMFESYTKADPYITFAVEAFHECGINV
jgi:hypothetical protein